MASNVEYRPVPGAANAILNGPGVLKMVDGKAESIRSAAAGMFGAKGYGRKPARTGYGSAHAVVFTGDRHAMRSNRKHSTLSKAMRSVK